MMTSKNNLKRFAIGLGIVITAVVAYKWIGSTQRAGEAATFTARRGTLEINVLMGGAAEAKESQAVKCEVRGYQGVKILKIVEEGYQVTAEDIRTNKILVELDSSELDKLITQQNITFESTVASLTDARQAYEIQMNQNVSDINAASQKARFARMDFDKFLSSQATKAVLAEQGLPDELDDSLPAGATNRPPEEPVKPSPPAKPPTAPADANAAGPGDEDQQTEAATTKKAPSPPSAVTNASGRVYLDFSKYSNPDRLGDGEAMQKIRKFEDELKVALKSHSQTKTKLEGTQRLYARGFVTKTELELDEYFLESDLLKVKSAESARDLFLKYDFPKSCEEFLSKYAEAARELERARKGAISKLAQAEAKLKAAEGRYNIEERQRKDLIGQIEKCKILAKTVGLVVYGGGNMNNYYYGNQEQIREGALVREHQPILTIPDMSKMAVEVRIHETYIKKVQKGLKARITVEAFPEKPLNGSVTKVGVLPDSRNMWMNPDMKVYATTVTIEGTHPWLKPGMGAKVEIMVQTLPDVIHVPIQAVIAEENKHYCLVVNRSRQEKREVEVGEFNDEFIEIKKGISAGEKIILRAPEATEKKAAGESKAPQGKEPPPPAAPPSAGK